MSNLLKLVCFGACLGLISCGPSAQEQAAAEKHVQDSISAAKVQMEAAREAARQQQIDDSVNAAKADTTATSAN